MNRVPVCAAADLGERDVRVVDLSPSREGMPRTALVLRDETGAAKAYVNLCMHLPIPLDAGRGRFMERDGDFLVCRTHGATYRRSDGYCVEGPCEGMSLEAVDLVEDEGVLVVIDRSSAPQT